MARFGVVMAGLIVLTGILAWSIAAVFVVGRMLGALARRRRIDITDRVIVVTGCDSGFGRGVVLDLAGRGARVVACCFTEEGARAALAAGAVRAPRLDLTDDDAIEQTITAALEVGSDGLFALVHNAGVVLPGFIDYLPEAFYRSTMEVNFFGPAKLTRRLLPALKRARGRVVVVSSVDGLVSLPGNAAYDASKFAIEAWADALRAEMSFFGVGVSVVNPATMRTPLALGFFEGHRKSWDEMGRLEADGPWRRDWPREWLDAYVAQNTRNLETIAQSPTHAIHDIVHAVTAARPRLRYLSGTLARTLFYALWVGPESWALRIKTALIQPRPPGPPAPRRRPWRAALAIALAVGLVVVGVMSSGITDPAADAHIAGVLHVNINCSDFERSRAFYEHLGFRAVMDVAPAGEGDVARAVGLERYVVRGALLVHADGSTIDLLEWREPRDGQAPPGALHHTGIARIALHTRDLDADVARLKARGVEFLSERPGVVGDGVGGTTRFICFKDPDGTVIELVELGTAMSTLRGVARLAALASS